MTEFPQKVKDQLGKELSVVNSSDEVIQQGVVEGVRWSDTHFKMDEDDFLGVEFLLRPKIGKSKWSRPFPTELKRIKYPFKQ